MKGKFDYRSYAAANTFPVKVLTNKKLLMSCRNFKEIVPIHLQLNPTNKCNFSCPICSCSSRDRTMELKNTKILKFMELFQKLGGESVTITGGGEPFMHKQMYSIVEAILSLGIKVGIVSNGTMWHKPNRILNSHFDDVTWIRVSSSDDLRHELIKNGKDLDWWIQKQCEMVNGYPSIDWAFSHVVTSMPDYELIARLVDIANDLSFTHVRLVSDIFKAQTISGIMLSVQSYLDASEVDDKKVNYQDRADYTKGVNPCLISLLKPVVAADGNLYPCCGVQYALPNPMRDYEKSMAMGSMDNLEEMVKQQKFFDGSRCVKCYYNHYNDALDVLLNGVEHQEFI